MFRGIRKKIIEIVAPVEVYGPRVQQNKRDKSNAKNPTSSVETDHWQLMSETKLFLPKDACHYKSS